MNEKSRWRPILEGASAERAWAAVRDVAAAVPDLSRSKSAAGAEAGGDASLSSGGAGLALFYAYLAATTSDEGHADLAERYLDHAIEVLASGPQPPGLFAGFTGVGWVVEHLEGWLFESDGTGDGAATQIDDGLLQLLDRPSWNADYDLISGLVGFGVYALEGLPRGTARAALGLVVGHLEKAAQAVPEEGTAWLTAPELLPPHQRRDCPRGYYNLGMAHGVPGALALLAAAYAAGVESGRSHGLLDDVVRWLLNQEDDRARDLRFPCWVGPGIGPVSSRLAWCYGDLGLAVALFSAARATGRADWESAALRIARRASRLSPEVSGVVDAGLCHGAAGLGHLFNRLYQATGDEALAEAARFWFRHTLDLRRPGEGVAGFRAWSATGDDAFGWQADAGFLTGTAGVALALLGAVTALEPSWDRVLLSAVRPKT